MPKMPLVADPQLRLTVGSFGAKIHEDGLHVPPEVYAMAKGWRAMSAEEFFSAASYMPRITGICFVWPRETARQAIAELAALLRGHVPDAILAEYGHRYSAQQPSSLSDDAQALEQVEVGPDREK